MLQGTYACKDNPKIILKFDYQHFIFEGEANFIDYFGKTGKFIQTDDFQYTIQGFDDGPHFTVINYQTIRLSYGMNDNLSYNFLKVK